MRHISPKTKATFMIYKAKKKCFIIERVKNTYLIKKSSNLIEFSHSHPVNILKGKLLPERETNFKIREEIFLILLLISILY